MMDKYICSSNETSKAEATAAPSVELPVFFASDRKEMTSNKNEDGHKLAPLQLGSATVIVPDESCWNSKDSKHLQDPLQALGWQIDDREGSIKPYIELRGYVAEADKQAVLRNVHDDSEFWNELQAETAATKQHHVYVYIHGFASSGENSLYAAGVLSSQLQAPVVDFTWPSAGRVGKLFNPFGKSNARYLFKQDRKMIDNPQVMKDLTTFLIDLKKQVPEDTKVDLVAHSLGNRLLTRYLNSAASERFDSVYFLAPDVNKREFVKAAPEITSKADHAYVFMNPHDKVLAASGLNNLLELHSPKKAGKSAIEVPGLDFINYGAIAQPRGIGHYLPFDQFGSLVRTGNLLPDQQNGDCYFLSTQAIIERSSSLPGKFAKSNVIVR